MHIGIFSTQLGTVGGPSVVDLRTINRLGALDRDNRYSIYEVTPGATRELELAANFTVRKLVPQGKFPGVAFALTHELRRRPVDVLHASFVPPVIIPRKLVVTMTCWSQFAEPEVYPPLIRWRLQFLLNRGTPRAAAVFCYTEYLKQKVMERFGLPDERVFVTRPGLGPEIRRCEDPVALRAFLDQFGINRPYILFIGSLTRRKNVPRLLEAFHRLRAESGIDHQLVLVGETLFLADDIFATIERLGLTEHVVLTGRRPHADLPLFYTGADLFVFPTLSEGFGMPPLEAQACGTPVAAARVSSVPEVVGEAAVMFDPYDVDDMASAIHSALTDAARRERLIAGGLANAGRQTWDAMAAELLAGYTAVHAMD